MFKKLVDWFKIKKHPERCPSCGCEHLTEKIYCEQSGGWVEERHVECSQCGRPKYLFAFGTILVKDWKVLCKSMFKNKDCSKCGENKLFVFFQTKEEKVKRNEKEKQSR